MKGIKVKRIIFVSSFILIIILLNTFSILIASPVININNPIDFVICDLLVIFSTLLIIIFNDIFNPIKHKVVNIIVKILFYLELIYRILLCLSRSGINLLPHIINSYFKGVEFLAVVLIIVEFLTNIIGSIVLSISYYKKK